MTSTGCYKWSTTQVKCFNTSIQTVVFCFGMMTTSVCIHYPTQCLYALAEVMGSTGMCCVGADNPSSWTSAPASSCSLTCDDGNVCGGRSTVSSGVTNYLLSAYSFTRTVSLIKIRFSTLVILSP